MDTNNVNASGISSILVTGHEGKFTVDVERYVAQLEKRLMEQEQLITLLNQKIVKLESGVGAGKLFSTVLNTKSSAISDGAATWRHTHRDQGPSFVGSKKTSISSVSNVRYSQFFVTRLDPELSAADLTRDLLKDVGGLSSVKCSKLRTRHSSYASFHVVVPEGEKQWLECAAAWPEGAFIKTFFGRLLKSYILESFDSQSNDSNIFTPPVDPVQVRPLRSVKKPTVFDSTKSKPKAAPVKVAAIGTIIKNTRSRSVSNVSGGTSSPKSAISPKNLRPSKINQKPH